MAVRKRESKLFDRIKKNIKNVHFTRIESSTVNGIPDVHGTGSGNSFWLELKSNTDISSPLAELLETLQSNMRP
jgi:hypothetical protein